MKQNLPHPQVHCDANHAHCLPSECIADFLAHNNKFPPKKKSHQVQSMFDSPIAKTIHIKNNSHGCKTMPVHMWSNDFEPKCSKTNRGSVWIALLTVETFKFQCSSFLNVCPLAVGEKDRDHQVILSRILLDLKALKKKVKHPAQKCSTEDLVKMKKLR